jgi:Sec-independent protein secretion pathway component TatC
MIMDKQSLSRIAITAPRIRYAFMPPAGLLKRQHTVALSVRPMSKSLSLIGLFAIFVIFVLSPK